ncbi:protein-disulfide reductase DsbD domain-containing protein [Pedobacter heparinus]|uniref:protein-disulfide reductase DsbD domain-containing protein n=1 Tax=Pedobacter heparinus TaxID=984 RepID=UPI00292DF869|nr:protein-disulfide reductase DsbD domain-containing protein [Pedobacter heparinus]
MRVLIAIGFLLFVSVAKSQIYSPLKWSCAVKKIGKDEAIIYVKGVISDGWHIYSVDQPNGGPLKTNFTFSPSAEYSLIGKVKEPAPMVEFAEVFKIQVFYFKDSVVFEQKVKLTSMFRRTSLPKGAREIVVKGKIDYMACTEERCTPPLEMKFSIPIKR